MSSTSWGLFVWNIKPRSPRPMSSAWLTANKDKLAEIPENRERYRTEYHPRICNLDGCDNPIEFPWHFCTFSHAYQWRDSCQAKHLREFYPREYEVWAKG